MRKILYFLSFLFFISCNTNKNMDMLVYNAKIYTVDSDFNTAEAMVINDGKIIETGTLSELENKFQYKEKLDAGGGFVYPGFIDAHSHFVGYGIGLRQLNIVGYESWEEIVEECKKWELNLTDDEWLIGRGWDQNRWTNKNFPDNSELDKLFPDRPVYLTRVDGHAVIANSKALELAGVKPGDEIAGGTFEVKDGKLTGILIDNAIEVVRAAIPKPDKEHLSMALSEAQGNCFAVGLTSLAEAGLEPNVIEILGELQEEGKLKMRIYAMLSANKSNLQWLKDKGTIKTDYLSVRSFKSYGDGALGSRGACLLEDYSDRADWKGFLLSEVEHFDSIAKVIYENDWQLCTHAIGDSANRTILQVYSKYLKPGNDKRWRIEHSQIINPNDFHYFGDYAVVPSVQPTHATSDMYWAGDRLGTERLKGGYANRQLMDENGWIPLGTDFPIEDISPFKTFFAAVIRKDAAGFPEGGFQMENALTREQALRGMTIWAAKANFEENEKGSLEKGKFADFIILDKDLLTCSEDEILNINVKSTYVGGVKVYGVN